MLTTTPAHDFSSSGKTTAVRDQLGAAVAEVLESRRRPLRLGKDAFLAVLLAEDWGNCLIHPEEERILPPLACEKKRNEFVLGRAAARYALRELGVYAPVLRGDHGEPLWPEGILGSITHCWPWAVALVVKSRRQIAVGIDLENVEQAARVDISRLICTAKELDWVRHSLSFHERIAMVFSAKETVYKGFYPFCRQYIDFGDVELSWIRERQSFRVSVPGGTQTEFPPLLGCEVHCRCLEGLVFSCMVHETALGTV